MSTRAAVKRLPDRSRASPSPGSRLGGNGRVVGIDPGTLAFRFDAGEAGTEPEEPWEGQLATDGYSLVFVGSPRDDRGSCELRSVDTTTGRTLWSRPVGMWRAHRFVAGHLVVWSDERVEVLAPANGQVVAAYG